MRTKPGWQPIHHAKSYQIFKHKCNEPTGTANNLAEAVNDNSPVKQHSEHVQCATGNAERHSSRQAAKKTLPILDLIRSYSQKEHTAHVLQDTDHLLKGPQKGKIIIPIVPL